MSISPSGGYAIISILPGGVMLKSAYHHVGVTRPVSVHSGRTNFAFCIEFTKYELIQLSTIRIFTPYKLYKI